MNVRLIQDHQDLMRVRALSFVSLLSYWLWHFYYIYAFPNIIDSFAIRIGISLYSFGCFYLVTFRRWGVEKIRPVFMLGLILHLLNEAYLIGVNQWNPAFVFSYLAIAMIVSTSVFSIYDYILISGIGSLLPFLVYHFVPIESSIVTQMLVCIWVIFIFVGLTVRSNFLYRQEIIKQNMNSIQNSKMAALGQMAAGVAHEINNPLSIIKGKADQLIRAIEKNQIKETHELLPDLQKVSFTVERIAKIIKGLRSFSRESSTDPMVETELETIVQNTLALCEEKIRSAGVAFNLRPTPQRKLLCHESQITQILMNLINNAIDAMSDSITKKIDIDFQVKDENLKISVRDSGPGIPPEIQHRLMEPFFTTKEVGKGTGLGLSISQGLADSHGGKLFLDTTQPQTCFVLELPLLKSVPLTTKPKVAS